MTYNHIAKAYNELHKEEQKKKIELIKELLNVKKEDKLLDLGCGTAIAREFFDCDYTGVDNSKQMLKQGEGKLIFASAEKLPFKDKTFDVIICVTAIHNFKNIKKAINEIKRVKKDNAKIAITLLKKAKNFNKIKELLLKSFKFNTADEEKDIIFYLN